MSAANTIRFLVHCSGRIETQQAGERKASPARLGSEDASDRVSTFSR